ncbi:MAG: NAD(P)/FAD-dependent oxidoreductase [Flavobacteriaceae bacterium]|nr:NAD(P)/FAD-dependent oxidoreductase [Flavobacteriaceae bacterium]MDP4674108.1 NAD(P)/FAD-dependent oxidoreductase [Flavobacteriaceae bacterium]MDP4793860.1 NAD(P)/FAD-dependent oxidoreductase [Flavobacteriaceae bacterium]MDP4885068.1 NAD(P)/FAD-dependent oxidoreductase [Flavobacteriaceae bacterium]MDP4970337.1 NAD(P)/FAD-dependent oxidoreductase [Flavobacteriaceae bacterium]
MRWDIAIVGAGASGYYAAIHAAQTLESYGIEYRIALLERAAEVLSKVRISGGGRCNVTHDQRDPRLLVDQYPRGHKALLGPFHHHGPDQVIEFFAQLGVSLKTEPDGRMFPTTDRSETIINALVAEADRLGVQVLTRSSVQTLVYDAATSLWQITTTAASHQARTVLVAAGSSPQMGRLLEDLGHQMVAPVPSLFTFHIQDPRLEGLMGLSAEVSLRVLDPQGHPTKPLVHTAGPLLITHWGVSGPAVLKASAWGARMMADWRYNFSIEVNWLPQHNLDSAALVLAEFAGQEAKKSMSNHPFGTLPKRLWERMINAAGCGGDQTWAHLTKEQRMALAAELTQARYQVTGKSTFKEEFVTAGGVDLGEVRFKDLSSKRVPQLFFAGECLDVDAVTGGYNFQNAWTTGYLAAQGMVSWLLEHPVEARD